MKQPPAAVVAISGLYELDPLRFAFIQDELNLTEEDVANYSPQKPCTRGALPHPRDRGR